MKQRVSDYIADFLADNGITDVFTVVGGGAMHLNDSFGHHPRLHSTYNHHEQASAMAAEGYARINGQIAALCVTSGPGAINALNGVVGAYQDSIPMLVFSGQVKSTMTIRSSGLKLRTYGGQEFDIVSALPDAVKYSCMIEDPCDIRYCLEKALYLAENGRKGPCWLDIPLDIQVSYVETEDLRPYAVPQMEDRTDVIQSAAYTVAQKIAEAKRPVFYAGNGIRLSGAFDIFHKVIEKYQLPVATCWDSIDLMENSDPLFAGRGGTMGDRPGNFAVQNSDLLVAVGSRLSVYQVGYNKDTWARGAYRIAVDIDPEELKKPSLKLDMPIVSDAGEFLKALFEQPDIPLSDDRKSWIHQCQSWKEKYPVVSDKQRDQKKITNVYAFIDYLSRNLPEESVVVAANGSCSVVGSQTWHVRRGHRFIMNCALSSMGYELPASIGACIANGRRAVYTLAGDGSIMMNLQELQTIVTNRLPIHIFLINNSGYHQIRQTQNNIFCDGLVGVGPESGDLGFPDWKKIACAFGIPYYLIKENSDFEKIIPEVMDRQSYTFCEVICDTKQKFEPKSATKRLPDGTLESPPLEDMAPFLSEEELRSNMLIN
jgi:acetolactate synthase-1/2/3 large subunit